MLNEELEFAKWFNRSLKLLTFRPRSIKEVTDYLFRKKIAPDLISKIIDQLIARKLLDDRAFALWFVGSRIAHRPRSQLVLKAELAQKGIDRGIIEGALQLQLNPENEMAGAQKLAEKKLRTIKKFSDKDKLLKLRIYLWQKGYRREIVEKTLEKLQVGAIDGPEIKVYNTG